MTEDGWESIGNSENVSLSKRWETGKDGGGWYAAVHVSQAVGHHLATEQQWIGNQFTAHYEGQYCNMKEKEGKEAGRKVKCWKP